MTSAAQPSNPRSQKSIRMRKLLLVEGRESVRASGVWDLHHACLEPVKRFLSLL